MFETVFRKFSQAFAFLSAMVFAATVGAVTGIAQDEVEIYEYEPYRVHIGYTFEASVDVSPALQEQFLADLKHELKRTFRSAWRTSLAPLPQTLEPKIVRQLKDVRAKQLLEEDLVLVVSSTQDATKNIRSTEIALDKIADFAISDSDLRALQNAAIRYADSPLAQQLVEKASPAQFAVKNVGTQIPAAIMRRSATADLDSSAARVLPLYLPWQVGSMLRDYDKLFFLVVGQEGDDFYVRAKEIDCPMFFDGPMFTGDFPVWSAGPRIASTVITRAFAPIARIERSTRTTADLLLKAGGLIVDDENPAKMHVGEVLQPVVRKDDRNGMPVLLQAQPWTFAAISEVNGEEILANVYSFSGGSGLGGRANRRTQRVVLRVRPQVDATDIQVVVAKDGTPQSGCFIYERDLITDKFEYIGRTDWRGRISIPVPDDYGTFLPDEIKQKRLKAMREKRIAAENAGDGASSSKDGETTPAEGSESSGDSSPEPKTQEDVEDYSDTSKWEVPLRSPLKRIYVKSGEFVMAHLSVVPGLQDVEVAELLDDRLRLEIEAFVKGYQNEVIELIGRRRLLAARVQLYVNKGKLQEAKDELNRLRGLKNYTQMSDGLVKIQRRFLGDDQTDLPAYTRIKIDRMFATTRELLQKYLQDSVVDNAAQVVEEAEKNPAGNAAASDG